MEENVQESSEKKIVLLLDTCYEENKTRVDEASGKLFQLEWERLL